MAIRLPNSNESIIDYDTLQTDGLNEFIDGLLNRFYPIGTIYESTSYENPSTFIGGSWEVYGQGRVTVGLSTETEFNTVGKTGGAKTHKLLKTEMPSHIHDGTASVGWGQGTSGATLQASGQGLNRTQVDLEPTGGDLPHNNLQPYITVYRFRRTA